MDLALVNHYCLEQNQINLDFLVIWLLQIPQLKKRKQKLTFSAADLLLQLLLSEVKTLSLWELQIFLIHKEETHYLDKNQVDFLDRKSSLIKMSKAQNHYLINPQKKSKRHHFSHNQLKLKFKIHSRNPRFRIPLFKSKTNKQKLSHLRMWLLNQSLSARQQISEIFLEINKKTNQFRILWHQISSSELHNHQTHYFPNLNRLHLLKNLSHQPQHLVNLNPLLPLKNLSQLSLTPHNKQQAFLGFFHSNKIISSIQTSHQLPQLYQ